MTRAGHEKLTPGHGNFTSGHVKTISGHKTAGQSGEKKILVTKLKTWSWSQNCSPGHGLVMTN